MKQESSSEDFRIEANGFDKWLKSPPSRIDARGRALVLQAYHLAREEYPDRVHANGEMLLDRARGIAQIVANLGLDAESIAAALLLESETVATDGSQDKLNIFTPTVSTLVHGVRRLAPIQELRAQTPQLRKSSEKAAQLEVIRKMLLAMVEDIRVVLIKLADQIQTLRYLARHGTVAMRQRAATDTLDLLAPLANRLGVWQLKWELEDLAFRCHDPQTYKQIAVQLDEKRTNREDYLSRVIAALRRELAKNGIEADVRGRPKHIYSIWKKMQRKNLKFEGLSDIRAVRILVDTERDCYTVLGLVHQLWSPIPGEFDDYIAKPKANDYQSLHTTVAGPDGKILEVQIRTREMHQHAELGVAAHWRYKEGSRGDIAYDRKIAWLRQILDWRDDVADASQLTESFRSELRDDSVYALTPQGRVINLPAGATPIDFAYHVHTELGHRCRGAKVDGRLVPLTQPLKNGQVVDIQTARDGGPSRDWMTASLGYIASTRVRAKVRQWFKSHARDDAISSGRIELEKALQRIGHGAPGTEKLADFLGYASPDDLFIAIHRGEVSLRELRRAVVGKPDTDVIAPSAAGDVVAPPRSGRSVSGGAVVVDGVDRLLTVLARCCKPLPTDSIVGFVSRGRGITVHRTDCTNLGHLSKERLVKAQWALRSNVQTFETDVEIFCEGQAAPISEILDIFAHEKLRIVATNTDIRGPRMRMFASVEVNTIAQLDHLMAQLAELKGVVQARRC